MPPKVAVPPLKVSVAGVVVLLLPMTWLAAVAPLATARPATVGLNPSRSSVPFVVAAPKVTVVAAGSAALVPSWSVPLMMLVPPL